MEETPTATGTAPVDATTEPTVRVLIWAVIAAIAAITIGATALVLRGLAALAQDALVLLVLGLVAWSGVITLRLLRVERRLALQGR